MLFSAHGLYETGGRGDLASRRWLVNPWFRDDVGFYRLTLSGSQGQ